MAQAQAQADDKIINYTILRFNFTEDIMSRITYFAKLHQFEDRETYKTNWNRWFAENQLILEAEINRLTNNGYTGDVEAKMYKAGRYYFRKKQAQAQVQTQAQTQEQEQEQAQTQEQEQEQAQTQTKAQTQPGKKQTSKYTTMNKAVLEDMDNHIITSMRTNRAYTPAGGYTEFCERFAAVLAVEMGRLKLIERLSDELITKKIKKTYKNRYFMVTR
jgi:ATPase subunit of ABC transporter with duplicated ATPase domains